MSEERPETCEMCGAPVVWCKCGMSEDIVDRLRDLKKWYGFIMTTERMISSNQTIEAAAVEIARLTAELEAEKDKSYTLAAEVKSLREIIEAAKVDREYSAQEIARLYAENALLKAEPGQSLVLRCGELEAEIADMREHFSIATKNLLALERENKKVCKALSDLYDACMQADGEGELHYTIDGDLLDAARVALGGEDASNAAEKRTP